MIPRFLCCGKCAISVSFFFFQLPDSASHFPEHHLRNVAGGGAQDGNGLYGIEVIEMGKALGRDIPIRVISAADQEHISYAVGQSILQPHPQAVAVQVL